MTDLRFLFLVLLGALAVGYSYARTRQPMEANMIAPAGEEQISGGAGGTAGDAGSGDAGISGNAGFGGSSGNGGFSGVGIH